MRNPKFKALLDQILILHESKNSDYATTQDPLSNLKECRCFGVNPSIGVMVRISDKYSRMKQLLLKESQGKTNEVQNENIEDTAMDLAVYSLLFILLRREPIASNTSS